MIREVIHRLSRKYDTRMFTIRCFKGISYVAYVDGAPEWFIKDILYDLNPAVRRYMSKETKELIMSQLPDVSGINKHLAARNYFNYNFFKLKKL